MDYKKVAEYIIKASGSHEMYPGVKSDPEMIEKFLIGTELDNYVETVEINGEIKGVIVGIMQYMNPLFSIDILASELLWYVDPEYRGEGKSLVRNFEYWAKSKGATHITMSHMNNEHADRLGKYYEKLGYTKTETTYMKKVN